MAKIMVQRVYKHISPIVLEKGHNCGPQFLVWPTPLVIKMCCCRVWGVASYLKSVTKQPIFA